MKTAFVKWKNLTDYERAEAIKGIPLNIAFMAEEHKVFPTRRFCSFVVWLNQERWEGLIEAEEERCAQVEHAKTLTKERKAAEESAQHVLELVAPVDERRAKIASAHSALIKQQKPKIVPVLDKCRGLEEKGRVVAAKKAWDQLRVSIPYLPLTWKELQI